MRVTGLKAQRQGVRICTLVIMGLGLAGCGTVSTNGPLVSQITDAAGKSAAQLDIPNAAVFDLVDVDLRSARLVSAYTDNIMRRTFGLGRGAGPVVIGVGDKLQVTIFEAGIDGLFSTKDSKQTNIQVVVQPNGKAAIPYVGEVRFAGRSLEQARQVILAALKGKAVEPDVIITSMESSSRTIAVSGSLRGSGMIPLDLNGDKITEMLAKAGGPANQPFETYVTLIRGGRTARVLLSQILDHPSEDVYVRPGDQLFTSYDPRTFVALGETVKNARIPFGSADLNLVEAIALAGGSRANRVDAHGYFIFRYEDKGIVERLLGQQKFDQLVQKGMTPDKYGRYPIVYRIDLDQPDSLLVGQTFPIHNGDVIYASRHPSVDVETFMQIINAPFNIVRSTVATGSGF